ncbi:hypothetical protein ACKVC7_00935 (plasmid) [Escherichia coli]
MIVLLDQYTANGTYGQYFDSDEPSLRDDAKMVVLELGGAGKPVRHCWLR